MGFKPPKTHFEMIKGEEQEIYNERISLQAGTLVIRARSGLLAEMLVIASIRFRVLDHRPAKT